VPSTDTRTAGESATAASTPAPSPSSSVSPSASADQPDAPTGEPKVNDLATGLRVPWGILPLADGTLLVSERETGAILRIDGSDRQTVRTLDVETGSEGGLLGLAITGDTNTVFAYYSTGRDNRIVAMNWDGSTLGKPKVILDGLPHGGRHNGGGLLVGPDNLLYVGTGDTSQTDLAQDRDSLAGKILRLTLAGEPAPGNPFDSRVYSYGHRNVQGLAFDDDDRLWASEFGENDYDELNLISAGANYGWPKVEGSGDVEGLTNPKVVWQTSEASPSGLAYWRGSLWMAALRGTRLWQIPVDGTEAGKPVDHLVGDYGRLRAVSVAEDGDALLVSTSNTDGRGNPADADDRILRLVWS
ncbi:MAG: PQQ-dependent sugar dehydrogenase, partial [Microlunatus sp.]|nr:PQQ-dependent sugar dehydrogenase [Microlunatus sp.]